MAYLTVQEVCEILKAHTNTVYKMCRQGVLPAVKIGKEWRIDSEKLDRFMEEGVRPKTGRGLETFLKDPVNGEHVLGFFGSQDDIWDFEQAFFLAAPKKSYRLMKACWWQRPDDVRRRLTQGGLPVAQMEADGNMLIVDLQSVFAENGPIGAAGAWFKAVGQSLDMGFQGLWGSGSPTFDCCGCHEGLVEFEGALDHMLKGLPATGVCSYVMPTDCSHDLRVLIDLIDSHDRFFLKAGHKEVVAQVTSN